MDTRKQSTPEWLKPLLHYVRWSEWEFLSILAGLPPTPPRDAPAKTRKQLDQEEERRRDAARHVDDAIEAGELIVEQTLGSTHLEKIRPHLEDPVMLHRIEEAVYGNTLYSRRYKVKPDAAIRWAVLRRDLFPDFPPFDESDFQPSRGVGSSERPASDELKDHRKALVARVLTERGVGKQDFCKQHDLSTDTLRGMINGERHRCGLSTEKRVLKLLGITEAEWGTPT